LRNMAKKPPPEEWKHVKFTCKIGAAVAAHVVGATATYNNCYRTRLWYQPCCTKCMHPWTIPEMDAVKSWWKQCSEYYNKADVAANDAALKNTHADGTILRPPTMPPMRTRESQFNPRSSTARSSTVVDVGIKPLNMNRL